MPSAGEFPLFVDLKRRRDFTFAWWLNECRKRGYRVLLARDESHAIAVAPDSPQLSLLEVAR